MANYRRMRVRGGRYFFTVALADRGSDLLLGEIACLREAVRATRSERPFGIDAWVVLPDHLHCLWTLPAGDADYATRWRLIKTRFSRALPMGYRRMSHVHRQERGVWQRRYWEHTIRDAADYREHMAFCWRDPVRHGLVDRPAAWPHSSIHRDIRLGRVAGDWM